MYVRALAVGAELASPLLSSNVQGLRLGGKEERKVMGNHLHRGKDVQPLPTGAPAHGEK